MADEYPEASARRAECDSALVERYGGLVRVVQGDPRNLKLTRPEDVELAERVLPDLSRAP